MPPHETVAAGPKLALSKAEAAADGQHVRRPVRAAKWMPHIRVRACRAPRHRASEPSSSRGSTGRPRSPWGNPVAGDPITRDELPSIRARLDQLQAHVADLERTYPGLADAFEPARETVDRLEHAYQWARRELEEDA